MKWREWKSVVVVGFMSHRVKRTNNRLSLVVSSPLVTWHSRFIRIWLQLIEPTTQSRNVCPGFFRFLSLSLSLSLFLSSFSPFTVCVLCSALRTVPHNRAKCKEWRQSHLSLWCLTLQGKHTACVCKRVRERERGRKKENGVKALMESSIRSSRGIRAVIWLLGCSLLADWPVANWKRIWKDQRSRTYICTSNWHLHCTSL